MSYPPTISFDPRPPTPPPAPRPRGSLILWIVAGVVFLLVSGLFTVGLVIRSGGGSANVPATDPSAPGSASAASGVGGRPAPTTRGVSATIVVPNGVGLNYQQAQDLWREAGLHVSPAIDALGAHRLPVIDSNWLVVAQEPKAGVEVATDSFITATVKKYTDD